MFFDHRCCHCGTCEVKCNLHGQSGMCTDCGNYEVLGTIIQSGKVRHICNACCDKQQKIIDDKALEDAKEYIGNSTLEVDEICIDESKMLY